MLIRGADLHFLRLGANYGREANYKIMIDESAFGLNGEKRVNLSLSKNALQPNTHSVIFTEKWHYMPINRDKRFHREQSCCHIPK